MDISGNFDTSAALLLGYESPVSVEHEAAWNVCPRNDLNIDICMSTSVAVDYDLHSQGL
jgi:hypothetical protein